MVSKLYHHGMLLRRSYLAIPVYRRNCRASKQTERLIVTSTWLAHRSTILLQYSPALISTLQFYSLLVVLIRDSRYAAYSSGTVGTGVAGIWSRRSPVSPSELDTSKYVL